MRSLLLGSALLASCYAPELRDCTVTCSASTDCGDDQVCGGDGFCAAPDVAGTCTGTDSDAATVALRTRVEGRGSVEVAGVGTCATDCTWQVPVGVAVDVRAISSDQPFERWTTPNCMPMPMMPMSTTCTLAMTASAIVAAKFH
jgi:hypothetical protein